MMPFLASRGSIAPTAFTAILSALLEAAPEVEGAIMVDGEGEAVDQVRRGSATAPEHEEFCLLAAHVQIVHRIASKPLAHQITVQTSDCSLLSRHLGHGYLLVLRCQADSAWSLKLPSLERSVDALAREAFGSAD